MCYENTNDKFRKNSKKISNKHKGCLTNKIKQKQLFQKNQI